MEAGILVKHNKIQENNYKDSELAKSQPEQRYSLRQVHRNIYIQNCSTYINKRSNNSIIIKHMQIPLSPLGSCTHGPTPTGN
jgi:hypothetical protein